jgi:type III secretory pathway lipoprotein EscJ
MQIAGEITNNVNAKRLSCLTQLALFICAFFLLACNDQDLALGLQQSQAIEIVALLHEHEILATAQKEKGGRNTFAVTVDNNQYHQAMSILQSKSLPKVAELSFDDLVSQRSILHNSRDIDALRLDKALALELQDTLKAFPAVVDVKVIVRNKFTDINTNRGVSVFLTLKAGEQMSQAKLFPIVERAVPGINKSNIIISTEEIAVEKIINNSLATERAVTKNSASEVELVKFLIWQVPKEHFTEITLISILTLILALVVGIIFGYGYSSVRHEQTRRTGFEGLPEPEIMSLRISDLGVDKNVDDPDNDVPRRDL